MTFESLLNCTDSRHFLSEYLVLSKGSGETLSSLSKRAGLSSAGFLSDVIKGKKQLSAKSLPRLKEALQVPAGLEEFFEILVFLEKPELAPASANKEKLQKNLRALRSRLREKWKKPAKKKNADVHDAMGSFDAYLLFAALEPDRGLSRDELLARTGLSKSVVEKGLELFARLELIYEFDGKIHSNQENFENFGEEFNSSFQGTFIKALELLQSKARNMNEHQKDLFYFSTFLVHESEYEAIQSKLKSRLIQEMDKVLPQSGEKVAALIFSIYLPNDEKKN
jgi:uncharacterized protein (TIGR02147 family)